MTPVSAETGELAAELADLRRGNPQGYGYLARYWEDAKQGLDDTTQNYAPVGHIHGNIPEPRIDTRSLGYTLTLLADLGVIAVQTTRSNATIYDLTTYDPDTLAAIGRLLTGQ